MYSGLSSPADRRRDAALPQPALAPVQVQRVVTILMTITITMMIMMMMMMTFMMIIMITT